MYCGRLKKKCNRIQIDFGYFDISNTLVESDPPADISPVERILNENVSIVLARS